MCDILVEEFIGPWVVGSHCCFPTLDHFFSEVPSNLELYVVPCLIGPWPDLWWLGRLGWDTCIDGSNKPEQRRRVALP